MNYIILFLIFTCLGIGILAAKESPKDKSDVKSIYQMIAQKTLETMRKNPYKAIELMDIFKDSIQKAGLTVNDLGGSEDELSALLREGYKMSAQQILKSIEKDIPNVDDKFDKINLYLKLFDKLQGIREKQKITLEEIGTNEKRLTQLLKNGCKISAQYQLKFLRKDRWLASMTIWALKDAAQKGDLTLEEIGTNEEELANYLKEDYKITIQACLKRLRNWGTLSLNKSENIIEFRQTFETLMNNLERGGFSLKEVGTNEEEIAKFLAILAE